MTHPMDSTDGAERKGSRFMAITTIAKILDSDLSSTGKMIMTEYAMRADRSGIAWPSIGTVSQRASVSRRTVQRTLPDLISAGWLEEVDGPWRSTAYRVLVPRSGDDTMTPRGDTMTPGGGDTMSPQCDTMTPQGDTVTPRGDTMTPDPSMYPSSDPSSDPTPCSPPVGDAPSPVEADEPQEPTEAPVLLEPLEPPPPPDPIGELMQTWPTASGRALRGAAHRKRLRSVRREYGYSVADLRLVRDLLAAAEPMDVPPWVAEERGMPAWAATASTLAHRRATAPASCFRANKLHDPHSLLEDARAWDAAGRPPWPVPCPEPPQGRGGTWTADIAPQGEPWMVETARDLRHGLSGSDAEVGCLGDWRVLTPEEIDAIRSAVGAHEPTVRRILWALVRGSLRRIRDDDDTITLETTA